MQSHCSLSRLLKKIVEAMRLSFSSSTVIKDFSSPIKTLSSNCFFCLFKSIIASSS